MDQPRLGRVVVALVLVACDPTTAALDTGLDTGPADVGALDAGSDAWLSSDAGPSILDADLARPDLCPSGATPVRALATGGVGGCAVDATGQLWCWGENVHGQVRPGGGTWTEPVPIAYEGMSDVVDVVRGWDFQCVLREDGSVWCWGRGGELGDGTMESRTTPVRVVGLDDVDMLRSAGSETCARTRDGRWLCWGLDAYGGSPRLTPTEIPALRAMAEVVPGATRGVLRGDGTPMSGPLAFVGIHDAIDVTTTGDGCACALRRDGSAWCWSSSVSVDTPWQIRAVSGLRAFAEGSTSDSVCGVRQDGSVNCFACVSEHAFEARPAARTARVATGAITCAADCDGSVRCNGAGVSGENGDGVSWIVPHDVEGVTDAIAIDGLCALRADGSVLCWAPWRSYVVGTTSWLERGGTYPVGSLANVTHLARGNAIARDGTFARWTASNRDAPVYEVSTSASGVTDSLALGWLTDLTFGATEIVIVSASGDIALPLSGESLVPPSPARVVGGHAVLTADGHVYDVACTSGGPFVCTFGPAWARSDIEAAWFGDDVDCVRTTAGEVWCQRFANPFPVSDPTLIFAALGIPSPATGVLVHVPLLDGARQIVTGRETLCALDTGGGVECWGGTRMAGLGTNDVSATHARPMDRDVVALSSSLVSNGAQTCALRTDGTVACWQSYPNLIVSSATRGMSITQVVQLPPP